MDYNSFYRNAAQVYNDSRLDEGTVFYSTLSYITSHIPPVGASILDIGCGTGQYGFALQEKGYEVLGVDKSPDQIAIASRILPAICGDILNLEHKNDSFDVVLLIMMIHQLEQGKLVRALEEVSRVLRPGGIVIIKTCFEEDICTRITSKYFPSCLLLDKTRFPSKEQLISSNKALTLISTDRMAISVDIPKEKLIRKFRARGASNIGMLSDDELDQGIARILEDYSEDDTITLAFDHTFLVFSCTK